MKRYTLKPDYHVNLLGLQRVCEGNYLRLMHLLPDLSEQHFRLPLDHRNKRHHYQQWLLVDILERAPYTTVLRLHQEACWGSVCKTPTAEVRLYHDVKMAEVISRNTSQILQPRYDYPNRKMHQPDEKAQHNLFLAQWLDYALSARRTYTEQT